MSVNAGGEPPRCAPAQEWITKLAGVNVKWTYCIKHSNPSYSGINKERG